MTDDGRLTARLQRLAREWQNPELRGSLIAAAARIQSAETELATERRKRRNYDDRIVELETELDHINRPAP